MKSETYSLRSFTKLVEIAKPKSQTPMAAKFKTNFVVLTIELHTLGHFLEHVVNEAAVEIGQIHQRADAGEFHDSDDLSNAVYFPWQRQVMAARLAYYELNALIESEIQNAASPAWRASKAGPKPLDLNRPLSEQIPKLQQISDLGFGQLVNLIEKRHNFKLNSLPHAQLFSDIRETVNAFKHRKGRVNIRKVKPGENLVAHHEVDVDVARDAIGKVREFIEALRTATQ